MLVPMGSKTEQLQIRVTPAQKAALKRAARAAGTDVSSYVLARLLPPVRERFATLLGALEDAGDTRYVLAELHDLLAACPPALLADATASPPRARLSPHLQNYVAAMVELAADQKGVRPPAWTEDIAPLAAPAFASPLRSHRLHLLRTAPVPFKRRNIFVDSSVGDRV